MKSDTIKSILLFILILCSINFFNLQILDGSSFRFIQYGYLLLAILVSLPYLFSKREEFVLPVQLIIFSVFASIFIATLTREQSLLDSIQGTIPYLIWILFFYLIHIQFPVEKIEKLVVVFGILYLILYFLQFTHPDNAYLFDADLIQENRGITRIIFSGRGIFYLSVFIAINKFTTTKKNFWLWTFLLIMGIVVTIMQVSRQFIVGIMVIYFFHFLKGQSFLKKMIILTAFSGIMFFYISKSNSPIVEGLIATVDRDMGLGLENLRVQEAKFYLTEFSKTTFNRIFGNGVPYGTTSGYMKYYSYYSTNYAYWFADVGLIAVYAMFGIFAVFGHILIWIKSFVIKVPKEYFYLKYYLWFLLVLSLTTNIIYGKFELITTVFVVYIYQTISHNYTPPAEQSSGYVEFAYPSKGILNWE